MISGNTDAIKFFNSLLDCLTVELNSAELISIKVSSFLKLTPSLKLLFLFFFFVPCTSLTMLILFEDFNLPFLSISILFEPFLTTSTYTDVSELLL